MAQLDQRLFLLLYAGDGRPSLVVLAMVALSAIGSGWSLLGLIPLFALRRTRGVALSMLLTFGATALAVALLKAALGRARPAVQLGALGVRALFDAPHDCSLPSGHAAGGFAFAAFVATLALSGERAGSLRARVALAVLAFALAAGIALSRVVLGAHFPGDVLAGALLGAAGGALGARLHGRFVQSRPSRL